MRFEELDENGFGVLERVLDGEAVSRLTEETSQLKSLNIVNKRKDAVYGVRNLIDLSPAIGKFSQESEAVKNITKRFLGADARVVRAIYFDKNADANWKVSWHQDLTIAVRESRERIETPGFSVWTRKAEIDHVQPPIEILEKMLTLRFHLDDADETNGALKVIPKSHKSGRLSADEIKLVRRANQTRVCSVKKGDCLIMRPLILHSSSAGSNPKNRRVIHLEFAAQDLPNGLEWYGS